MFDELWCSCGGSARNKQNRTKLGRVCLFFSFLFLSVFYCSESVQTPFDIEPFLRILGFLKLRNTENLTATNHEVTSGDSGHAMARPRPSPINSFSLELWW